MCLVTRFSPVPCQTKCFAVNKLALKETQNSLTYTDTTPANSLSFHSFFFYEILPTASLIVLPLKQFFPQQDGTISRHWLTILMDMKKTLVFFNYKLYCNWRLSLLIRMESVSLVFSKDLVWNIYLIQILWIINLLFTLYFDLHFYCFTQ